MITPDCRSVTSVLNKWPESEQVEGGCSRAVSPKLITKYPLFTEYPAVRRSGGLGSKVGGQRDGQDVKAGLGAYKCRCSAIYEAEQVANTGLVLALETTYIQVAICCNDAVSGRIEELPALPDNCPDLDRQTSIPKYHKTKADVMRKSFYYPLRIQCAR